MGQNFEVKIENLKKGFEEGQMKCVSHVYEKV